MKYTHKGYCKANQPDVSGTAPSVQPVLEKLEPLPKFEPMVPTYDIAPKEDEQTRKESKWATCSKEHNHNKYYL